MFYLTTHSTHFSTVICRRAYNKGPFRYRERKTAAATTWTPLFDWEQGVFDMYHPTERIAYITAFVAPVVEHCYIRGLVFLSNIFRR